MFQWGCGVDLLREGEEGGQFLSRRVRIGLLLGRSVEKKVVGQILVGRSHIRMGIIFLRLGLFVVIKRIRLLELGIELL